MANNKELERLCDQCGLSMELCTELNMLTMRQYPPISKERKQDVEYARKLIRAELQRFANEVEEEAEAVVYLDRNIENMASQKAIPVESLSAIKKKWGLTTKEPK